MPVKNSKTYGFVDNSKATLGEYWLSLVVLLVLLMYRIYFTTDVIRLLLEWRLRLNAGGRIEKQSLPQLGQE